jgi:hypothetical protein
MNATFDVYLKAYSSDSIDVKRIGREGNSIKHPRLSLILTCQTDVAKDMINNSTFREKGLPARFLYATCRSNLGNRRVDNPDIPVAVKAEYNALIRRLLDIALTPESPEYELTLSADGRAAYHNFSSKVEAELGGDGSFSHMRDWAAKLVGQMLRIAGIIAVCENRTSINSVVISRAAELAEWYAVNAVALFSKSKISKKSEERETDEQYLLRVLRNWNPKTEMTVREVRRITIGRKGFDFDRVLAGLKAEGYISVAKKPRSKSEIIELVP